LELGSARRKAATKTQNKRTQTTVPGVGFEPTVLVFERAKTVHTSEREAAVVYFTHLHILENNFTGTSVIKIQRKICITQNI
jgi:hypothetical protein